jgi:hypothetical protein
MSETKHTPGPWKVVPPAHGHPTEYLCVELDAEQMYGTVEMLPADARLIAAAPDLLEALQGLFSNPHIHLGDLVYMVRDRECEGWDGPAVKQWSDAVMAAQTAIKKATEE